MAQIQITPLLTKSNKIFKNYLNKILHFKTLNSKDQLLNNLLTQNPCLLVRIFFNACTSIMYEVHA